MTPILCDYCDALASMFFPRRGSAERSFACADHEERAKGAVGAHDDGVSGILPDRPRFEELDLEAMLARWREYRARQRSAA
jgi:hypothetical protein